MRIFNCPGGQEAVSMVLKREVFVESQQRAREEIAGLRRTLAESDRLIKDDDLYAIEQTAAG